ncbi:MAG: response regulator [Lachnospiraceae bacterium]|nr:response regulator [Lachnospiraceae bacterium]
MYQKKEIQRAGYRILIIDDDKISCNLTSAVLREHGFKTDSAQSGADGILLAKEKSPDLILLDKQMPQMDGFETNTRLKQDAQTSVIPVVFLTGMDDHENEIRCFEEGAEDFIRKPFVPEVMVQRLMRIIEHTAMLKDLDYIVSERTSELREEEASRRRLSDQIIYALAGAVDAKDEYTNGHSQRVADYAVRIADLLGKDEDYKEELYYMGLLHDIGKIGIPDDIIHKDSKLTDEEYATIRQHPVIGAHILDTIEEMPHLAIGAHYHHERFDGRGYPDGLEGYEIPEQARILAVADSYDAMTSTRTYHDVKPQDYARTEIKNGSGTQFDPVMANAMLKLIDEDVDFEMKGEE